MLPISSPRLMEGSSDPSPTDTGWGVDSPREPLESEVTSVEIGGAAGEARRPAESDPMRVLLVHNYYQQPGGEDTVFASERNLLVARGHQVWDYVRRNDEIRQGMRPVPLASRTVWARDTYRAMRELLECGRPQVAHFHNVFPLISPSAYYACRRARVPVVQTLHNYRLLCPSASLFRDGRVCEDCTGRSLWQGVRHGCYRGSRAATATVASMLAFHRWRGTWSRAVDCYVALSDFARRKFIEAGLPAEKIVVKPNFVSPDPGERRGRGDGVLFVGRLSSGKGLETLLAAWSTLDDRVPLRLIGDGPLREWVEAEIRRRRLRNVSLLGALPRRSVMAAIKQARFVVFPSELYETFGLVVVESFACGSPVVASRLGPLAETVTEGRTGLCFVPGDAEDLAAKVGWAWSHEQEMSEMGRAARREFETRYSASTSYQSLMRIYRQAIDMGEGG